MGRVVPIRLKRVAEVFDVASRERSYESSGSEHSSEETMNLSDLVDSFIENEAIGDHTRNKREVFDVDKENELDESEDLNQTLRDLFSSNEISIDEIKQYLVAVIEEVMYETVGNVSSPGFKRRLMTAFRAKGFNAGLCKSKWEKNEKVPSGSYEYIDIDISGTRYIIEVYLATQFEIARPTDYYSSLIQTFPSIFIGKIEDFKRIVRLMCTAMRHSMKSSEMALPPWRRYVYMHAKWFGSYNRTINESSVKNGSNYRDENLAKKKSVGFVPLPTKLYYCQGDFVRNGGLRMGQLTMEMNGTKMLS